MFNPAIHYAILIIDVESFGDPVRTNAHQLAVREAMYEALRQSFARARISWAECAIEDRGDGILVLVPATVPKSRLVVELPGLLAGTLDRHNAARATPERIRLRMALHAGEVHQDTHGFTGTSINRAFRLIEAQASRIALRDSTGVVALIVSNWFYDEVVRHHDAAGPSYFRQVHVALKETGMTAWVRVLDATQAPGVETTGQSPELHEPGHALLSSSAVRYSLPPDTAAFAGREEELDRITTASDEAAGAGGVVQICAIDGMPGVGKTALAVHVAHLLGDRFPDRKLFINLRAHTPGQNPLTPEAALTELLTAIGVDARYLPEDLESLTGLWRDRMAGQRTLLVADNAASSSQVTPLLSAGGDGLVLVTSRRHLGDLPGSALAIMLPILVPDQARAMFLRLAPRASGDHARAVAELVQLAGYLPLAISLLARVYASHLSWTLADLIRETRTSILTLTAEKDTISAVFEVSYRYLNLRQRRFFRRMGLHPGTTIDDHAAAALAGITVPEAGRYLAALHREGLLVETGYRRYGMHDLIRRYARERAARGTAADQNRRLERLFDYYQYTATIAETRLARQAWPPPGQAILAAPPVAVPDLPDRAQALAWARTERPNLLACLDQLTSQNQYARVIALSAAIAALLRQDGPWGDAIARHTTAAEAARHLEDLPGEAKALNDLGDAQRLTGNYAGAESALLTALRIFNNIGDLAGQANTLRNLAAVRRFTGDFQAAAQDLETSLSICRDLGDHLGEVNALSDLGVVRRATGSYADATAALEEALDISRDTADRVGQANALSELGIVRYMNADYQSASAALEAALDICSDLGDRLGQVNALSNLGVIRWHTGDNQGASSALETALDISRHLGNRIGQANALTFLGAVRQETNNFPNASEALESALDIFRDTGSKLGQANALHFLGILRRKTGDTRRAADALDGALSIYHKIGDRDGEAETLNEIGVLHRICGDLERARAYHHNALGIAREIGSPKNEANALAGLGRCARANGDTADAEANLQQALGIFQKIGTIEAAAIATELDAMTGAEPPTP